jgi:predicted PurR-regulated permease PerM
VLLMAAGLYFAVALLVEPASDLIARSDEIGNTIKEKFRFMDRPLFALRELQTAILGSSGMKVEVSDNKMLEGVVAALPDIAVQFVLFFATLFFFVFGRQAFRRYVVNMFSTRDGRLRALRVTNDIEHNLSTYLLTVTAINIGVGAVITLITYTMGFPAPLLWGALAFLLNYIPYVGPGIMHVTLFIIGLLTFPTLLPALVAPLLFMAFTFVEGHFLVPAIIGRQLLLHPLAVFLSLAFWAWLWGPVGALLATPLLIMAVVMIDHVYPRSKQLLPD